MKKRLLALLMCTVMVFTLVACSTGGIVDLDHDHAVPLVEGPGESTDPPATTTCTNHVWGAENARYYGPGENCLYGETWVYYKICTICGATSEVAYRPKPSTTKGSHQYVTVREDYTCPDHPYIEQRCSVCGDVKETPGGHSWSKWTAIDGSCDNGESRTCSYCHQTETQSASHYWLSQTSVPATCTEPEQITQRCSKCGQTRIVDGQPALGHGLHRRPEVRPL